ncbi:response regulator transcription factor [Rhodobacteraceae bacterium RKSG542]|uniref:response regulator transcription factor n=1 Tax=Pseudovibrio flavus TaxID=2529854 RepID=UPI0012BD2AEC|nr:response regulator transcription factor [Pseudovibrio flavus]MTI16904.1 response regulator transcription factor [Pseudovibrio flavus]
MSLSSSNNLIAIVDDEEAIRDLLTETLNSFGFETRDLASGMELINLFEGQDQQPDLIITDLGLPDIDGMALIERVRQKSSLPILVLSARDHSSDRVIGLELGADDYVTKPFDPREIVARVRSLLRRSAPEPQATQSADKVARFSGWSFEPASHLLRTKEGVETYLSAGEAAVLNALLKSPRRVLSRDQLLDASGADESMDRAIDVRISRVRKKLTTKETGALIRTVYGAGYMLSCDVEWSA